MSETKICSTCGEEKPLTEYYIRKETGRPHGRCKPCFVAGKKIERNPTHKTCKHCGESKPFSEYQKAGGGKWLQPYCKPCDSARKRKHYEEKLNHYKQKGKEYYEANKEQYAAYGKKRYQEKRPQIDQQRKIYYEREKEQIKERSRQYAEQNRDKVLARKREYYQKNKEQFQQYGKLKRSDPDYRQKKAAQDKAYRDANQGRIAAKKKAYKESGRAKEQAREYSRKKNATDVVYKIKKNIRTRIRIALKRTNGYKSLATEVLMGCTVEQFRDHLQSLFTEGMTWDKFLSGEIVIDHIKPCKLFDLTKESEQRECFSYKNSQPLWKLQNLKKGASYPLENEHYGRNS